MRFDKRGEIQRRPDGLVWVNHATLESADLPSLAKTERLTLWNVRLPPGFLEALKRLWWLDLRGGSGADLDFLEAPRLRYLQVNQVRGMRDLSALSRLTRLELLSLYGLPKVAKLPSFAKLRRLRRVELGSLIGLRDLRPLAAAPKLRELFLQNRMSIDAKAMLPLEGRLKRFDWFAEGVPRARVDAVLAALHLPEADSLEPEEFFGL